MKRALIIMSILFTAATAFAQTPTASITEMSGTVEIKRQGAADWLAAGVGDAVEPDTIVSTGFKSTAIIAVGSSTLVVRPLTRLSLAELINMNETETVSINLSAGRIRVEVNAPAGSRANFSVQTPSATASVRGTSFEMDTASIRVIENAVSYAPSAEGSRPVTVSAGQETYIDTETGRVLTPMETADENRALPALHGQSGVIDTGSPRVEAASGSLDLGITLNDGK